MNLTRESATALALSVAAEVPQGRETVEVVVAPPSTYLLTVRDAMAGSGVGLAAQNAYFERPGAFTGEVAVEMLLDVGCRYVILGHSERRHILGETDALIGRKVTAALGKGLGVILCVGELLSDREAGQTETVLDGQLSGGLDSLVAAALDNVVIAYEPVWAIGTGVTATPQQAESTQKYLRDWLVNRYNSQVGEKMRILYGGSVKPDNARDLLDQPDIDGALVGGASLKTETFTPIIEAAVAAAG